MQVLDLMIQVASGLLATTYGWGEMSCGSHPPRPCVAGEVTASGEQFDPARASAAVASPRRMPMRAKWIWLRLADGPFPCVRVRLNDKSHPRWMGDRGFDLSPAAVRRLTSRPAKQTWSAPVTVCDVE
jgi:hypothetical protein